MRPTYFSMADGRTVDASEALLNGVLRDGYGTRTRAMMKDQSTIADADELRAHERGVSLSQAAYENRVSDSWKNEQKSDPVPRTGDDANGQAAYERRIADAWKGVR